MPAAVQQRAGVSANNEQGAATQDVPRKSRAFDYSPVRPSNETSLTFPAQPSDEQQNAEEPPVIEQGLAAAAPGERSGPIMK